MTYDLAVESVFEKSLVADGNCVTATYEVL